MTAMPWRPRIGMQVYVLPVSKGAPGVAYRQPRGRVVHVATPEVTVELADGTQITTHETNVRRTVPPQSDVPTVLRPRRHAIDPKHGVELTFDFLDAS